MSADTSSEAVERLAARCGQHADTYARDERPLTADCFDRAAATLRALAQERDALKAEVERMREALTLAEDVLARPPWSCNMLADGRHPNGVITAIRAALGEPQR